MWNAEFGTWDREKEWRNNNDHISTKNFFDCSCGCIPGRVYECKKHVLCQQVMGLRNGHRTEWGSHCIDVPEEKWLPINRKDENMDIILRVYEPNLKKMKTWIAPKAGE